ncbi:unnamed protein product [Rotaria sp. Silwood2]|nr:unnamed protein product [Rotaria sp. Silwood2]CAF2936077.1 unnamed protein product [Rotaria sp. Silwood2]CAF3314336.1 unnamed protein product [Rotaria sp. Silwood2]CAF3903079.1 unnamed protein product [Rotaria sp. Silwood2]CAF3989789.1 unnamed protein product [Rotaria sp. Silwood2]
MSTPRLKPVVTTSDRQTIISKEQPGFNEQTLSQKLDQLSPFKQHPQQSKWSEINPTTTTTTSSSSIERTGSQTNGMDFDLVPDYLCETNPLFEKSIQCVLPSATNLEELRDVAILIHKIKSVELVRSLWIVYQKSGMGSMLSPFPINPTDAKIWPKEVQSLMKQQLQDLSINEDYARFNFVNHCLHELNMKFDRYRHELHLKTNRLVGYHHQIENHIEMFIQRGIQPQK